MPRLFFISFLLVVVAVATGFSSRQYFKGYPQQAAPIAGTESFYVVVGENPPEMNCEPRHTLVRLDPDGSITPIREIDAKLYMSEDITDGKTVVMHQYPKPPLLYTIATGELSPLPDGYKGTDNWHKVEGHEFDSLKAYPLLGDLQGLRIVRLYKPDYYLVSAVVPGSGGCTSTSEFDSVSGYMSTTFSTRGSDFYWAIADIKRKKLTKVALNATPRISSSDKVIFFSAHDTTGKSYPQFVRLEEYVK